MIIDAYGRVVPSYQQYYLALHSTPGIHSPGDWWLPNPEYQPPGQVTQPGTGTSSGGGSTPAPTPGHLQFSFDTIGQVIFRSIGHCRLPFKLIWVKGITSSEDITDAPTITIAGALCQPYLPSEEGAFSGILLGGSVIYDAGGVGVIIPATITDPVVAAALTAALLATKIYPGTEGQLPDPEILADRGAIITNAFRGLRYVVIPGWPTALPFQQLTFIVNPTNPPNDDNTNDPVVEFETGAG